MFPLIVSALRQDDPGSSAIEQEDDWGEDFAIWLHASLDFRINARDRTVKKNRILRKMNGWRTSFIFASESGY